MYGGGAEGYLLVKVVPAYRVYARGQTARVKSLTGSSNRLLDALGNFDVIAAMSASAYSSSNLVWCQKNRPPTEAEFEQTIQATAGTARHFAGNPSGPYASSTSSQPTLFSPGGMS